ncbi:MAG TPA: ribonuclease catalytic domain-containing protein, partial [Candidatus Polarisedimenticolia bacterium]|nr:ribonuclease catalytic domain-containing protein [Candidatus Polarisedimenticolia bacterium]
MRGRSNGANHKHDLGAIARQAMVERGLLPSFSKAALDQLRGIDGAAAGDGTTIRDLRGLLWASIDNDDSRDLDQLSVAETLPNGAVKVLVAIADVDAIVAAGSAIDGHARHNTTSVYTVPEIFPMLPERLSTDLTSLNESQERLAIVVEMAIDGAGACVGSDVYRARVLNRAKLAYNSVAAWLDGRGSIPAPIAAVPGLEETIRL